MKKLLFTLTVAVCFFQNSDAQDNGAATEVINKNKVKFGVFVAPNMSWMRPANAKSNDNAYNVSSNGTKIGFTWGLMADYWFAENYALATGLQVNGTGGKISASQTNLATLPDASRVYTADFEYALQYLEVPINLKLKTSTIGSLPLYFFGQAGATLGFNIGKKADYSVTTANSIGGQPFTGEDEKISGTLAIAPVMLQMNLGVGAHYPFSDLLTAYAGIFFNNGFLPDATNPEKYPNSFDYSNNGTITFSDGNIRLNNFALRLGLFF